MPAVGHQNDPCDPGHPLALAQPRSGPIADPHIPDAHDVYTVVVLRRPTDAPEMSDEELDAFQARHLAYRAELRRRRPRVGSSGRAPAG